MKSGTKQPVTSTKRKLSRSDLMALHARFLTTALRKRIQRMGTTGGEHNQPRHTSAREDSGGVGGIFARIVKQFECMNLESTIEKAVQYLRDNYNDLSSQEIADLEKSIVAGLEAYNNYCG